MISAVVVAWCFGKTKDGNKEDFAIASCNDYVKLLRCVADNSWDSSKEANAVIDQAIAEWKTFPEEELSQTCSLALSNAAAYAYTYEQQWCSVPWVVADDIVVEDNDAEQDNDAEDTPADIADPSVIEAISGKVDSSSGINDMEGSTIDMKKDDDDKKVEAIINETTTGGLE